MRSSFLQRDTALTTRRCNVLELAASDLWSRSAPSIVEKRASKRGDTVRHNVPAIVLGLVPEDFCGLCFAARPVWIDTPFPSLRPITSFGLYRPCTRVELKGNISQQAAGAIVVRRLQLAARSHISSRNQPYMLHICKRGRFVNLGCGHGVTAWRTRTVPFRLHLGATKANVWVLGLALIFTDT